MTGGEGGDEGGVWWWGWWGGTKLSFCDSGNALW